MNARMAQKILVPCFPKRKFKSRNTISRITQRAYLSREKILSHIPNQDIFEVWSFSKSPIPATSKNSSSIINTREIPSSTPRISKKLSKLNKKRKNALKSSIKKSDILVQCSNKRENFRYLNESLEDSGKNFNGVSTPPDETVNNNRSLSPFSDIIDEQLKLYINSPIVARLDLPNKSSGHIDSSYQYSTAESRKKFKGKSSLDRYKKVPEAPKTPPPFSILMKVKKGAFRNSSSRKYK